MWGRVVLQLALTVLPTFASTNIFPQAQASNRLANSFLCGSVGPRLPIRAKCDGYPDCPNGDDETGCPINPKAQELGWANFVPGRPGTGKKPPTGKKWPALPEWKTPVTPKPQVTRGQLWERPVTRSLPVTRGNIWQNQLTRKPQVNVTPASWLTTKVWPRRGDQREVLSPGRRVQNKTRWPAPSGIGGGQGSIWDAPPKWKQPVQLINKDQSNVKNELESKEQLWGEFPQETSLEDIFNEVAPKEALRVPRRDTQAKAFQTFPALPITTPMTTVKKMPVTSRPTPTTVIITERTTLKSTTTTTIPITTTQTTTLKSTTLSTTKTTIKPKITIERSTTKRPVTINRPVTTTERIITKPAIRSEVTVEKIEPRSTTEKAAPQKTTEIPKVKKSIKKRKRSTRRPMSSAAGVGQVYAFFDDIPRPAQPIAYTDKHDLYEYLYQQSSQQKFPQQPIPSQYGSYPDYMSPYPMYGYNSYGPQIQTYPEYVYGPNPSFDQPSQRTRRKNYVAPAWQGKINGAGATRCHNGKVLPFRSRCNKRVECSRGEDEAGCDWHKKSTVRTVTGRDFDSVLASNENVLVEFFAPWCPACVTFLPHLEKLKKYTKDIPVTVVKVNTDEDPELKKRFSVDTYPRVMMWSKKWGGQHRTYSKNQGMKFNKIIKWIRRQLI